VDDYYNQVKAYGTEYGAEYWKENYEKEEVKGFIVLNFWRPTLPMKGPVERNPLAFCEPSTVSFDDVLPSSLLGFTQTGLPSYDMRLKHSEKQKWLFYPKMTKDEVIIFKSFDLMKNAKPGKFPSVFHTSINDPTTPMDAEVRHSAEYRVFVFV
jgi:hypothetical protein